MTTPLEAALLEEYLTGLRSQSVSEDIIKSLQEAFVAEKLPSPDALAETFRKDSGGKLA